MASIYYVLVCGSFGGSARAGAFLPSLSVAVRFSANFVAATLVGVLCVFVVVLWMVGDLVWGPVHLSKRGSK